MGDTKQKDFALMGLDLLGEPVAIAGGPLAEKFTMPPFSVLSARDGAWRERKRAWKSLGIKSEVGRDATAHSTRDWAKDKQNYTSVPDSVTSIFDPVLCELAYRWFCPPGGHIVDPFAGGSVRGIVAGLLGFSYFGVDLRAEQIAANEKQREDIIPDERIKWACGDSIKILEGCEDRADFIFSCPPYGDLEKYSDDPADLSNMEYHTFTAAYRRIILRCAKLLKPGHLACFVVGDFRDRRTGNYRGFVADTINAFKECGLDLYNDGILVTSVGSLPIRVSSQFSKSRKLGKAHQNVLVFRKPGEMPNFEKTT